jgi:Ca-activated chloride channel family protein
MTCGLSVGRRANSRALVLSLGAALLAALCSCPAQAQSGASRNREGNRLFGAGKFPEAEKAYLEAQADLPDRPELFYNLGNTLVREKKYDLGLQALRRAASQGDRDLQNRSWFNSGNALFEMGNFGDAAQAYIQALRIDPSDADAKHNLELALKKAKEQPQGQGSKSGEDQESKQQGEEKRQDQQPEKQPTDASQPPSRPEEKQERNEPASPKSSRADRQDGSFTKERALQILDALQNLEFMEQRKQLERMAKRKVAGRDW